MKTTKIIAAERKWTVLLLPIRRSGFVVRFPGIPHLVSEGRTLYAARAAAQVCLSDYLASLADDPAALAALEAARQDARIERDLREGMDDEPDLSPTAVKQWMDRWDAEHELPRPDTY